MLLGSREILLAGGEVTVFEVFATTSTSSATVVRAIAGRQIGVDTEFLPHQPDTAGLAAGGSFQLATSHGQLDILQEGGAIPPYAELAGSALETEYEGLRIRYCSREHLIEMKRAARRPLDLRDLDELGAGE
jgi:hypothetical protein